MVGQGQRGAFSSWRSAMGTTCWSRPTRACVTSRTWRAGASASSFCSRPIGRQFAIRLRRLPERLPPCGRARSSRCPFGLGELFVLDVLSCIACTFDGSSPEMNRKTTAPRVHDPCHSGYTLRDAHERGGPASQQERSRRNDGAIVQEFSRSAESVAVRRRGLLRIRRVYLLAFVLDEAEPCRDSSLGRSR